MTTEARTETPTAEIPVVSMDEIVALPVEAPRDEAAPEYAPHENAENAAADWCRAND